MAGAKITVENKRSDISDLKTALRSSEVQRDPRRYLQTVQKVIAFMTLGIDMSKLFSEMIMAGATTDVVQKKLVYLFLCNYAESNSELSLLTVNTLVKDTQDRNPMIRGLALRSMCSLRVPELLEYLREPLMSGLHDRSPYVRRTAVIGCLKVFYLAPDFISELNMVDLLYRMLRDKDPFVVLNATHALNEILASEGGMVVNRNIAHYLLSRFHEFSEWGQCTLLEILLRYEPENEEELFDILNILDDRLKHANCGIVMATIKLFLKYTENMMHLHADVHQRIKTPLLTFLSCGSPELAYTCLLHFQLLLARQPDLFCENFRSFYCRFSDPPYLKNKKIEVLVEVSDNINALEIINELGEYAADVNVLVSKQSITSIGSIALRLPELAQTCVKKLLSLLSYGISCMTSNVLVCLTSILRQDESLEEMILPELPKNVNTITESEGKAALIWILGEYGEALPNSPYQLEDVVNQVEEESSSTVKLQLLTATMKLFFKRPAECQHTLGRLLEHGIDVETDMDVHDRAMLYYRLLKQDINEAKRIVCGNQRKFISTESNALQRRALCSEFNTLAVMYGKSSEEFITQETPYIFKKDTVMSPSGAEVSFDSGRFVAVDIPDENSITSSTSAGVAVGNLLDSGELLAKEEVAPSILLNPNATLSPADFERKWLNMKISDEMKLELDAVPSPEELQQTMQLSNIITMASSPANQPVVKFFFYAQHVSTFHYFLAEAQVTVATSIIGVKMKCDNPSQSESFMKHFRNSLVGKWIAQH
ncbi:AP-4 complex subunit beta-1-like [Dysidea avara]|uniref:AP-4 complex subunit beta-1-like n=1 Tax=Dysidea avara TaxID=196820 RepID=UPI003332526B